MIFKRNSVTVTVLIISLLLLCFFTSNKKTAFTASAKIAVRPQIILDAGHGGLTNTIMAILFATVQPHCCGAKS